jgi:hypothetical protein
MLTLRARRVLTGLMILTALIQGLDAITAIATGRLGFVPIDLAFTAAFLIGAAHLSTDPLWRAISWRDRPSNPAERAALPVTAAITVQSIPVAGRGD